MEEDKTQIQEVQVTEKGKDNPIIKELIEKKKRGRKLGWRGTYKKKINSENNQNVEGGINGK